VQCCDPSRTIAKQCGSTCCFERRQGIAVGACRISTGSAQLDAKRRFEEAVSEAGPGLSDILWRIVCSGEGMREAESALGWPARAGKLVLGIALDRVADYYRMR